MGDISVDCKIDFKGMKCEDVYWIHLAQDMVQWHVLVKTEM
jgi:hypothetical protein